MRQATTLMLLAFFLQDELTSDTETIVVPLIAVDATRRMGKPLHP
jgi:hypothetical protein